MFVVLTTATVGAAVESKTQTVHLYLFVPGDSPDF